MYDDLILRLRDAAKMSEALAVLLPHSEGSATAKLYNQAADAIEELSMKLHGDEAAIVGMQREIERMVVADKPRWIPVTERLPEYGQWLLCMCQAGIVDVLKYINGIAGPWYKDSRHVYMEGFVTHWMPLPEPPKGES